MEKIGSKYKICIFLCIGLNIFLPNLFAQSSVDNSIQLSEILSSLDQHVKWLPFRKQGDQFTEVTLYNQHQAFYGYNLLLSAHAPQATLMDMNGKTIHRWAFESADLPGYHLNFTDYWMRARILKDGDLLAMIPHGGLLKIDKDSHLIWFKQVLCHHDFDIDSDGNIYTLTIKSSKLKNGAYMTVDSIAILDANGELKKELSLYDLFNRYPDPTFIHRINLLSQQKGFFLTNNGSKIYIAPPGDAFHSNSIQVLDGKWALKIPAFKRGNLLISVHHLGLIICVDPIKEKIVWLMDTKFWEQGQNFAKLLDNGDIMLFDNHFNQQFSRVIEFDPATQKIIWAYADPSFYSPIAGLCYRLANGNTLITESTNGHAFEVTPDNKIVWEYYNPHQLNDLNDKNKSIATIFQLERIPVDASLGWIKTDHPDPFQEILAKANQQAQWLPLKDQQESASSMMSPNDMQNLQSLSYLQGYNPPSKFKNVTVYDAAKAFNGYNLFVSAHAPQATLMDMNGKTIHQWQYPSANYWDRARLLKNGDLLAMIPYGGLLKLDKNSHLLWFRKITCHHDLDIDSNGDIYTLTVKNANPADPDGIKIDSITILDSRGNIKKDISLYDLFNKYPDPIYLNRIHELLPSRNFITSNNRMPFNVFIPGDVFHSNSIQILDGRWISKIPAFKKGNLLISIRHLGLIICVDPKQEKIVWLMDTLFWNKGQHCASLLDNGNILVFDNYYRSKLSRIVEFDPSSKNIVWDYSNENGPFFSSIIGKCARLPNGNTLITESTNGHSFEVTPDKKIVWEYYNPHQLDKNSKQLPYAIRQRFNQNQIHQLIALTYQMERIPIDDDLDWLKK